MEPIERTRWAMGTPYASVIESDAPNVAQHRPLDTRQAETALHSTIACAR